jgi:hypothetical protein
MTRRLSCSQGVTRARAEPLAHELALGHVQDPPVADALDQPAVAVALAGRGGH